MLGFKGHVRTIPPLPAVNVNLGFSDILKKLDGAIMGSIEARFDRILLFSDLMLTKVGQGRKFTPVGIPVNVSFDSRFFIGLAATGYRLVEHGGWAIDAFLGARGFAMDSEFALNAPGVGITFAKEKLWLDLIGGARIRYDFDKN